MTPPPPQKKKKIYIYIYSQNLNTKKIFIFLKTPKDIKIQNFEKSLCMYEKIRETPWRDSLPISLSLQPLTKSVMPSKIGHWLDMVYPSPPGGNFVDHIFLEAQCLARILQHVSPLTMAALSCNSLLHMLPYKIFDN